MLVAYNVHFIPYFMAGPYGEIKIKPDIAN